MALRRNKITEEKGAFDNSVAAVTELVAIIKL